MKGIQDSLNEAMALFGNFDKLHIRGEFTFCTISVNRKLNIEEETLVTNEIIKVVKKCTDQVRFVRTTVEEV